VNVTFKWTGYQNPQYVTKDGSRIDVEVELVEPFKMTIPFTASLNDTEQHGKDLYQTIIANQYNIPITPYVEKSTKTCNNRQSHTNTLESRIAELEVKLAKLEKLSSSDTF